MARHFRLPAALILALALCLTGAGAKAATAVSLGEPMPDFTATTITGEPFTLSEALKEKELVLINLWATWCGPCRMEFPYLEEAWTLYQDRVAVIALSVEPTDTDETLANFAAENSLTFPIAQEGDLGFGAMYAYEGIPTSLVIDRFGNLVFREVGAQTSAAAFTRLFDYFLRDGYAESEVLDGMPPAMPTVMPTDGAMLSEAANAEGGSLVFRNPEDPYVWPMMVEEEAQGRASLISSNWGQDDSVCAALTDVTAAEGDALAFEFFTSTEAACDLLTVSVDGETVKRFGGEHGWTQWALALPAGEHEIAFSYVKDAGSSAGDDLVRIDNVRLVSGDEAAALLAALPAYPIADELSLTVTGEGAREIVFDDPDSLFAYFNCRSYWIVPSGTAEATASITADVDPEAALFYSNYDGAMTALAETLTEDGYVTYTDIDTMEATGYPYTCLYLYSSAVVSSDEEVRGVMLFADEDNVRTLVKALGARGVDVTWRYADDVRAADGGDTATAEYTVTFVDQDGTPVPGCIVNFCTDEACTPVIADENGVAAFTGAPYAYHLQVIKVPEGYEFDTAQAFYTEEAGGALSFTVTKK